jgi:hypothetical protein
MKMEFAPAKNANSCASLFKLLLPADSLMRVEGIKMRPTAMDLISSIVGTGDEVAKGDHRKSPRLTWASDC